MVANLHADTFNAAGLTRSTLFDEVGNPHYPGAVDRYDNQAPMLIDAYYLDWDIISFIQDYTPLQDAIGRRIKMDGPVDLKMATSGVVALAAYFLTALSDGLLWPVVAEGAGAAGVWMGLAHTTEYYHYGLMVKEDGYGGVKWDIYGYELF